MNSRKAQASLEYFIIFAVIAGLTLISAGTFLPQVRDAAEGLFKRAAGRILNPGSTPSTPSEPPSTPNPPPVIPPNAEPLSCGTVFRDNTGLGIPAGTERVFVIDIGPNTPGILVQTVAAPGYPETDVTLTWTFPDGREFSGNTTGNQSADFRLWSQNTPAPNIPDQYIPEGRHLLRIRSNTNAYSAIWMEMGC